ncbi:hypothetical protein D3C80_1318840 [compost metagenome]
MQQILRGAAAAVAVIAHDHHWAIELVLLHKGGQGGVGQMKSAWRMPSFKALWIADINQCGATVFQALVCLHNVDRFKLFHNCKIPGNGIMSLLYPISAGIRPEQRQGLYPRRLAAVALLPAIAHTQGAAVILVAVGSHGDPAFKPQLHVVSTRRMQA